MLGAQRKCSSCGDHGHDRRSCSISKSTNPRSKNFNSWHDLEYYEDVQVQDIIKRHPDGMTLEQVGSELGITRERVRQIEVVAMQKLFSGEGAGEVIEVDDQCFAVVYCERCGQPYPRRGRKKYCPDCDESSLTIIQVELVPEPRQIAARTSNKKPRVRTRKKKLKSSHVEPTPLNEQIEKVFESLFDFDQWEG